MENRSPGTMLWDRHTLLVLLLVAALHGTVNGTIKMNMALNSVDDRYLSCRDEMLKQILSDKLTKELASSPEFNKAWAAELSCSSFNDSGSHQEHRKALSAFMHKKHFRETFNNAVETMGGNDSFPFRSLHFLLTDVVTLHLGNKTACSTVYSASKAKYSAQKGETVRLGKFLLAESQVNDLLEEPDLDGGVLFNISSCLVLNMESMCGSHIDWENTPDNRLLFPSEVFKVEDVHEVSEDGYEYTSITLKHSGFYSSSNCSVDPRYVKGSSAQVRGCLWVVYLVGYLTVYLAAVR